MSYGRASTSLETLSTMLTESNNDPASLACQSGPYADLVYGAGGFTTTDRQTSHYSNEVLEDITGIIKLPLAIVPCHSYAHIRQHILENSPQTITFSSRTRVLMSKTIK